MVTAPGSFLGGDHQPARPRYAGGRPGHSRQQLKLRLRGRPAPGRSRPGAARSTEVPWVLGVIGLPLAFGGCPFVARRRRQCGPASGTPTPPRRCVPRCCSLRDRDAAEELLFHGTRHFPHACSLRWRPTVRRSGIPGARFSGRIGDLLRVSATAVGRNRRQQALLSRESMIR